jgi:hypothetical protein
MSNRVLSDLSAHDLALAYLADQYPTWRVDHVGVLQLASGWLVETIPSKEEFAGPTTKVLLMVDREGLVEELNGGQTSRRVTQRCLADLRRVNEVIDLR